MTQEEAYDKGYEDGQAAAKAQTGFADILCDQLGGGHFDPPSDSDLLDSYRDGYNQGYHDACQ